MVVSHPHWFMIVIYYLDIFVSVHVQITHIRKREQCKRVHHSDIIIVFTTRLSIDLNGALITSRP